MRTSMRLGLVAVLVSFSVSVVSAQWIKVKDFGTFITNLSVNGKTCYVSTSEKGVRYSTNMTKWDSVVTVSNVGKVGFTGSKLTNIATFTGGLLASGPKWTATLGGNIQDFTTYAYTAKVNKKNVKTTLTLVAAYEGLYSSVDNKTWKKLVNGQFSSIAVLGTVVYAATYDAGCFVSTNNCVTWSKVNSGLPVLAVYKLIVVKNKLYAGLNFKGVYALNGNKWLPSGLTNQNVTIFSAVGSYIVAGTSTNGIFVTTDMKTWASKGSALPDKAIYAISAYGTDIYVGGARGIVYKIAQKSLSGKTLNKELASVEPMPEISASITQAPISATYYNLKGQMIKKFVTLPNTISMKQYMPTGRYIQVLKYTGVAPKTMMITVK